MNNRIINAHNLWILSKNPKKKNIRDVLSHTSEISARIPDNLTAALSHHKNYSINLISTVRFIEFHQFPSIFSDFSASLSEKQWIFVENRLKLMKIDKSYGKNQGYTVVFVVGYRGWPSSCQIFVQNWLLQRSPK